MAARGTVEDTDKIGRLCLIGPVRLFNRDGEECTQPGTVRNVLLAMLALSRGGARSRKAIESILWGDYEEKRAANGLRTALSELRIDLERKLGENLIETPSDIVRLRLDRLSIDLHDHVEALRRGEQGDTRIGDGMILLEGASLRSGGESFEDWLGEERRHWAKRCADVVPGPPEPKEVHKPVPPVAEVCPSPVTLTVIDTPARLGIGVLPAVVSGHTMTAPYVADALLDDLSADLQALCDVDIFDYRGVPEGAAGPGPGPGFVLRLHYFDDGNSIDVNMKMLEAESHRLCVQHGVRKISAGAERIDTRDLNAFLNQCIDRIALALKEDRIEHGQQVEITPFHALNVIFRATPKSLGLLEEQLLAAHTRTGKPVYLGLLAYLQTYRVGEHWNDRSADLVERTREYARQAAREAPFDSITLTCAGHALSYVAHDHEHAGRVLHQAMEHGGRLAICHDHLALHYLYTGQLDKAAASAEEAMHLGRFSPLSGAFETTGAMVNIIAGDHAKGVQQGLRALERMPNYAPTLRYTVAGLGLMGDVEQAQPLLARLRTLAPGLSLEGLNGCRLALNDPEAEGRILGALAKAGLE